MILLNHTSIGAIYWLQWSCIHLWQQLIWCLGTAVTIYLFKLSTTLFGLSCWAPSLQAMATTLFNHLLLLLNISAHEIFGKLNLFLYSPSLGSISQRTVIWFSKDTTHGGDFCAGTSASLKYSTESCSLTFASLMLPYSTVTVFWGGLK